MALDLETREQLLETVRRFVAERLRPLEAQVSENNEVPDSVVEEMKALGLFGLTIPTDSDGRFWINYGQDVERISASALLSHELAEGALSDKILVLESGRFAIGWGDAAAQLGVEIEVLKGDWTRAVRPAEVEARLRR